MKEVIAPEKKTLESKVDLSMTAANKAEYLSGVWWRYQRAGREHKGRILAEFCAVCGYGRKWAIKFVEPAVAGGTRQTRRQYGEELAAPLKAVWQTAQQPCGKRLRAALPLWLPHLRLCRRRRALLLAASARTLDRLLSPLKVSGVNKRRCGTKPGRLLKAQIPIRTSNADIDRPDYLEVDTVAHCGGSLDGDHVWTLTLTDIESGWTCLWAVWNRGQHGVLGAVREVEAALPFKLLGLRESMEGAYSCALTLDSDNGG